jgi:hypothetical protein
MNANEREEELKILSANDLFGKATNIVASFPSLLYLHLFAFIRGSIAFDF